ncbi:Tbc1 Domain Family Member 9 [Manis pentadactyla]|nr:Tbc1 Domain Family Member 9 [Manis pentadactyla]
MLFSCLKSVPKMTEKLGFIPRADHEEHGLKGIPAREIVNVYRCTTAWQGRLPSGISRPRKAGAGSPEEKEDVLVKGGKGEKGHSRALKWSIQKEEVYPPLERVLSSLSSDSPFSSSPLNECDGKHP